MFKKYFLIFFQQSNNNEPSKCSQFYHKLSARTKQFNDATLSIDFSDWCLSMYLQKSQRCDIFEGSLGDISDVIEGQVTEVNRKV